MSKQKKRSVKRSTTKNKKRSTRRVSRKSNSKINIGRLDRIVRFLIGVVAVPLGYFSNPLWYLVTVGGLISAVSGKSYVYRLLNINTK